MSNVQFTALIRLPFARGNFVDPAQVRSSTLHNEHRLIHELGTMGRRQGSTALEGHLEIIEDE
jgi:hypothetical protein